MRAPNFEISCTELSDANRATADKIDPNWSADDQITAEMDRTRAFGLDERKKYYTAHRLNDQRTWYNAQGWRK
jgi:hypothetical protein